MKKHAFLYEKLVKSHEKCMEFERKSSGSQQKQQTRIRSFFAQKSDKRHLNSSQKSVVALEMLPHLEAEAKERQQQAGGDRKSAEYQGSVVVTIPQPIQKEKARDIAPEMVATNPDYISDFLFALLTAVLLAPYIFKLLRQRSQ